MISPFDCDHKAPISELSARLGGKGLGLWVMSKELALSVPPGFTIETSACRAWLAGALPPHFHEDVRREVAQLEGRLGKRLGDPKAPLIVSVRSGSAASMPGMMDTLLNVGMTPAVVEALAEASGDRLFAVQSYRRFLHAFGTTVLGLELGAHAPETDAVEKIDADICRIREEIADRYSIEMIDDPWRQLFAAIEAVFQSWLSPRARAYREREKIPNDLGTAVNVQAMVFGNLDARSGTGVAFTRNPSTGEAGLCGDFLFRAQGDDVVGGTHRTLPLSVLETALPECYAELAESAHRLEGYFRDLCDIEFTIERGKLWLLQARVGKRSPAAAPRIAVELVREGKLTKSEALRRIDANVLSGSVHVDRLATTQEPLARGVPASPGAATGRAVFDVERAIELAQQGLDIILVRRETSPEDVHGMSVARGIVTTLGGTLSHAAVVARAWNLPAVCGLEQAVLEDQALRIGDIRIRDGDLISIDGSLGAVYLGEMARASLEDPYLKTLRAWRDQETAGAGVDLHQCGGNVVPPRDAHTERVPTRLAMGD